MSDLPIQTPARPKVLVTGALGDIGSRSIPILEQSMDLRLTDLAPSADDPRYISGDLTDFDTVFDLLEGMEAVIHLAMGPKNRTPQPQGHPDTVRNHQQHIKVNVGATYHIFEAARQRGLRRVVYASSLTIHFGNRNRENYNSSTTPIEPSGLYACTKLFGENLARVYWRNFDLSSICLRIGQPFPIGHKFDDSWRTNKVSRSIFAEISDVARCLACAVHTDVPFGVFNLVSASDNPRFDLNETRAIGYVPRAYLSDQGLEFFENGEFPPPPANVVTQ